MTGNDITIGILETGRPPQELESEFPDYPTMVANWLAPIQAEFKSYAALDGELPNTPTDCDLWIITGSRFGVYERLDWVTALENFVRECHAAVQPMIGICFGHQLIAQALGGEVRKSDKGWGLGVETYPIANWPKELGHAPQSLNLQSYHQDQVERVPDGAQILAGTDFCPVGALWYPGFALTVQGHPEFESDYFKSLVHLRRGSTLTAADADDALKSQSKPTNADWLSRVVQKFIFN